MPFISLTHVQRASRHCHQRCGQPSSIVSRIMTPRFVIEVINVDSTRLTTETVHSFNLHELPTATHPNP